MHKPVTENKKISSAELPLVITKCPVVAKAACGRAGTN